MTTAVLLLLGEGDFSFSCDMAHHLLGNESQAMRPRCDGAAISKQSGATEPPGTTTASTQRPVHLIATGIDTVQEVKEKYKDSEFLLSKLRGLSEPAADGKGLLQITVRHGVNAILPNNRGSDGDADIDLERPEKANIVMFNHPHLGVESATLHAQFLSHLFHSVAHGWMEQDGRFFLTLAMGQWERWNGPSGAERCGLDLLDRSPFQAPDTRDFKAYYQQRRHQTGKSFASRTESGSETFTFCLKDCNAANRDSLSKPFWFSTQRLEKPLSESEEFVASFTCEICHKTFREKRSLKNHTRSKHGPNHHKRKRESFPCPESGCARIFETEEGLRDHIQATHNGLHSGIKPDWFQLPQQHQTAETKEEMEPADVAVEDLSSGCSICGAVFANVKERKTHMDAFVPSFMKTQGATTFFCAFCRKTFREKRAQMQHENFCSSRKTVTAKT